MAKRKRRSGGTPPWGASGSAERGLVLRASQMLITAAQEQAISLGSTEAGLYHSRQHPKCKTVRRWPRNGPAHISRV